MSAIEPSFGYPDPHLPRWRTTIFLMQDEDDDSLADIAQSIQRQFTLLEDTAANFCHVLRLMDYCEFESRKATDAFSEPVNIGKKMQVARLYNEWKHVAAREGAMLVFHFAHALATLGPMIDRFPRVAKAIGRKKLKEARKPFYKHFPHWESLRNSVAHSAEIIGDERKVLEHSLKGELASNMPSGSFFIGGSLLDRKYVWSRNEKLVSYELSEQSWLVLEDVVNELWILLRQAASAPAIHP